MIRLAEKNTEKKNQALIFNSNDNAKKKKRKVLLVEDDQLTGEVITTLLKKNGYEVHFVRFGEEALELLKQKFDIVVLDLLLPDCSGLQVLQTFRSWDVSTPVLILSGLTGMESKLAGLNDGADDYVTKPYHHQELILRMHALMRRIAVTDSDTIETLKGLKLDDVQQCVYYYGKRIHFTHKEYLIIKALTESQGAPITKEDLLKLVYSNKTKLPQSKIIDVFIFKIRNKLEKSTKNKLQIQTVWGVGIRIGNVKEL